MAINLHLYGIPFLPRMIVEIAHNQLCAITKIKKRLHDNSITVLSFYLLPLLFKVAAQLLLNYEV